MHPDVTPDALVSTIAAAHPATVAVFQRHELNFCCNGQVSISVACRAHGIDESALLAELHASLSATADDQDWRTVSLTALTRHIQVRYHEPLRAELPRIADLLARVLQRHGGTYPLMLLPLRDRLVDLADELLPHLDKEDTVLFPAIEALEIAATARDGRNYGQWEWIEQPISAMKAEHVSSTAKVLAMREATDGYTLPAGACPTFRGLFHGLREIERELAALVRIEDDVLFPRAVELARLQR
jgi:regulator of cell morphogenesis and NO signaling